MIKERKEYIIGKDFQGWPIFKLTLRDILKELKFEKISNEGTEYWRIADNNPLLDICPRVLEDDGMGYGIDEKRITEFTPVSTYQDDKLVRQDINVFIDKEDPVAMAEFEEMLKQD